MLVAEEKHNCAGIVELVHFIKVRDLGDVDEINNTKILDLLRNREQGLRRDR